MRDADNIHQLDEARIADWMGFIFFGKSSRHVKALPDCMPQNSKRVGVFVNEQIEEIVSRTEEFDLDIIQLHGHESIDYCRELKGKLADGTKLVKTFQISTTDDLASCAEYEQYVDYFLFETKCENYGGSGKQFDWNILDSYRDSTPFILTGGIGPEDVEKVNAFQHPKCIGIDLNSKFETAPAYKDIDLLKNFIKQIK